MHKSTKTPKRISSYQELLEITRKTSQAINKEFKTIPTKDSAQKSYLKKLEKELTFLSTVLNSQLKFTCLEEQKDMTDALFLVWKLLLNVLNSTSQLYLPSIFFKFITLLINRSEFQPHHTIVNNALLNEENKVTYYLISYQYRTLLYDLFVSINDILNNLQLIFFASMELKIKPKNPKKKGKKDKKKGNSKFDKIENPSTKTSTDPPNTNNSASTTDQSSDDQSLSSDIDELTPFDVYDTVNRLSPPSIVQERTLSPTNAGPLITLNKAKRESVMTKVLTKQLMELTNKSENSSKKSKRASTYSPEVLIKEDEFFYENGISPSFVQFIPAYLAFTFFQIPQFRKDVLLYFSSFDINQPPLKMCDGVEAQKNVWLKFPRLFGFDDFHNLLIQNEDQIEDGYSSISIKWMELLNPSNDIFMAFLFHWTKFIYFTLKKSEDIVYYGEIPGLLQFTSLYITERLEKEKEHSTFLIKELDKRFILIGFPMNLNILIRRMLEKTNSYSIDSCNTALSKIGKWLTLVTEHKRFLNDSFDMEQIEMLLTCVFNTDHYQLIINALIMLFNTSKCFIGKCRIEMYENFLIERWFFKLFCHWNFYVRQAFQHFVLYRFLLIRRTHLNWAKFNKNELDLIKKHNKMGCNTEATDRFVITFMFL